MPLQFRCCHQANVNRCLCSVNMAIKSIMLARQVNSPCVYVRSWIHSKHPLLIDSLESPIIIRESRLSWIEPNQTKLHGLFVSFSWYCSQSVKHPWPMLTPCFSLSFSRGFSFENRGRWTGGRSTHYRMQANQQANQPIPFVNVGFSPTKSSTITIITLSLTGHYILGPLLLYLTSNSPTLGGRNQQTHGRPHVKRTSCPSFAFNCRKSNIHFGDVQFFSPPHWSR